MYPKLKKILLYIIRRYKKFYAYIIDFSFALKFKIIMRNRNHNRKKITVATTISADGKVKAGGSNVLRGLYIHLAEYYDITLVFLAPQNEEYNKVKIADGLTQINVPRTKKMHKHIQELAKKAQASTLYDVGILYYLDETPNYEIELRNSIKSSVLVIVDRPYLFDVVERNALGRPIIQHSQNIEYYFRKSNLLYNSTSQAILKKLFEAEKRCCQRCLLNLVCSDIDARAMTELYDADANKQKYIANGIEIDDVSYTSPANRLLYKNKFCLNDYRLAIFIGGGHKPNIEAVSEIVRVARFCPNYYFIIAGDVCTAASKMIRTNNIILVGKINEKTREHMYALADVALNPMFSGSGANVKMIDYMAAGIPIISTKFGARGISDVSGIVIANNTEEIINALTSISDGSYDTNSFVEKNRKIIEEEYDWEVVAYRAYKYINRFL